MLRLRGREQAEGCGAGRAARRLEGVDRFSRAPSLRTWVGEFFEAVEAGVDRLPGRAARVFMLREVLGLAPAEVSRGLAISLPNCWVTLHRVKARLRELVPDEI